MRSCLFVNCKGYTIEQALVALNDQLKTLGTDEKTSGYNIHQVIITPTVEMPQKSAIAPLNGGQPQMVINVTCVLVLVEKEKLIQLAIDPIGDQLNELPDPEEVEKIKKAAAMFCQHTNLLPAKHSKAHRNPGEWYQICADCHAEVWQGVADLPPASGGLTAV